MSAERFGIQLTVIDLECTCEEGAALIPPEIIEIGAITGTLTLESFAVKSELQLYVRPTIHPTLTAFCTQLTGITQTTVDAAATLSESLPLLKDWLQMNTVISWASWGKSDSTLFAQECANKAINNPLQDIQHLNLKSLFARKFKHRVGLGRALSLRGLKFQGRLHSGIDDAKNIGHLLSHESLLRESVLKRTRANTGLPT